MELGVRDILARTGKNYQFHRIGSMFCLFFTEQPVWNLADAMKSDLKAFARYFHFCLENGIYFAPSQFEAGFLCTAHTDQDLERTLEIVGRFMNEA
jgi:glutamate-1-semialdehyde 2,1-aminomutase